MKRNLKTVASFALDGPFTESQLRWWIFNEATNGLGEVGAVLKIGRRRYIDVDRFDDWITRQNPRQPADARQ